MDNCKHEKTVMLDGRVSYDDVTVEVRDGHPDGPDSLLESPEPEEVEFPKEIEDLGIRNNGSGSCVDFCLTICLGCKKVIT